MVDAGFYWHPGIGPDDDRKPPPPPKPKQWDQTTFHRPHGRSGPASEKVTPPPVPTKSGKGGGRTVVDTDSMELFASSMDKLAEPVKEAYNKLLNLKTVAPGAFYDSYKLRAAAGGEDGIQDKYIKLLHALGQGLSDTSSGLRTLSKKYSTIEAENKISAGEVSTAMESAQGDFNKLNSLA